MLRNEAVQIQTEEVMLHGDLLLPEQATALVIFVHGSGSSRHSPRNRFVAQTLVGAGLGTLLMDLLTLREERVDAVTAEHRFDIPFLARRVVAATRWVLGARQTQNLMPGYFGASTGAAAALVAAAQLPKQVRAVVSRGGRPDLASQALPKVAAPTLLIVGAADELVLQLNQEALAELRCERHLAIVPGATHLFEEPGTLEAVAVLARDWFLRYLRPQEKRD